MIRKIFTLGTYSAVVSIPKELLKKVGLRRGQKVEISTERKTIKIKDFKNPS